MFTFFQDDWYHLYQVYNKNFLEILNYFNLWQKGTLDLNNFYRPFSTKLFYFVIYKFFGLKANFYFLAAFILFCLNALVFYSLIRTLFKKNALWVLFFYVFSLANFTYFTYITSIDNLFFSFFLWLSLLFWFKNKKIMAWLCFVLSLMSRESAIVAPVLLILYYLTLKKQSLKESLKILVGWFLITSIYLFCLTFIYGWPQRGTIYHFKFIGFHIFKNILKYLQWNLNITGLITQNNFLAYLNFIPLMLFSFILFSAVLKKIKTKKDLKIIKFGLAWWLVFLLPVLFFPNHADPWNLIISGGGMALVLNQLFQILAKKIKLIFLTSYLLLFSLGLFFYCQNHWTILRAKKVATTIKQVKSQCQGQTVILTADSEAELKELEYSWYYQLGPKVLCQNEDIEVTYQLINE